MDVTAYLSRIGAHRDDDLPTLMARHLEAVPFENLSVHLREPITTEPAALLEKIVDRRRGGFCYELNGAFALLLDALGYDVTRWSARVARGDGTFGPPGDHMALVVPDGDRRLLVDVGFGRFAQGPLDLDRRDDQADRFGAFALRDAPDGELDAVHDGAVVYRLDPRARLRDDFAPPCWWHATSPTSPFTASLICSRVTPTGRLTLAGDGLITSGDDGSRTERTLTVDEQLAAYRDDFGFVLDRVPEALHPR
jgi:N-hydroxyarylamine O-acetyltransferase